MKGASGKGCVFFWNDPSEGCMVPCKDGAGRRLQKELEFTAICQWLPGSFLATSSLACFFCKMGGKGLPPESVLSEDEFIFSSLVTPEGLEEPSHAHRAPARCILGPAPCTVVRSLNGYPGRAPHLAFVFTCARICPSPHVPGNIWPSDLEEPAHSEILMSPKSQCQGAINQT